MKPFVICFLFLLAAASLFSQTEEAAGTSSLNPTRCPTLSARPAYDLCETPTATITPNISIPPGATIVYVWSAPPGSAVTGGYNQQSIITASGGVYTLSASNSTSNCTDIRTYTAIACPVGIDEKESDAMQISVYPNPCRTAFELSYDQSATLRIFDVFGELLLTKHHEPGKQVIDISHLVNGAYYMKITSDRYTKTVKVLKD